MCISTFAVVVSVAAGAALAAFALTERAGPARDHRRHRNRLHWRSAVR